MEERKEKTLIERQNLYKVIKERREDGEEQPVARLLYAMQLNDQTYKQTIEDIAKTINEIDTNTQSEISGYLQARENYILHMIEGQSEIINQFMHYLYKQFNLEKQSDIIWINFLMITEENPTRMYDQHYVEQIQLIGQPATDIDKNLQSNYQRIWIIYQMFIKAGQNSINRADKSKEVKFHMEVQLSNDDIAMFAQKHFLSINDYYAMYLDEIEIDLDTEHVFPYTPMQTELMEYSEQGVFEGFIDQ